MRNTLFAAALVLMIAGAASAEDGTITVKKGVLTIGGYVQTGYYMSSDKTTTLTFDSTGAQTSSKETTLDTNTFKARRMRAKLSSTIIDKIVGGVFEYDFAASSLQDGYFWVSPQWEPLTVQIGRTKLPWMNEYLTSSAELSFVDRSLVADKWSYEFDYGMKLDLKAPIDDKNKVLAGFMYSNGYDPTGLIQATDKDTELDTIASKASGTTYVLDAKSKETDLKDIAFRLGYAGTVAEGLSINLGGGIMMNKATLLDTTSASASSPKVTYTELERQPITADLGINWATAKDSGLSVFASYTMDTKKKLVNTYELDETDPTLTTLATVETNDEMTGIMGGLTYLFGIDGAPLLTGLEPAVRYASYTDNTEVTTAGITNKTNDQTITQITGGLNLYMAKHNAKWQINYVMQNQEDAPYMSNGTKLDPNKKDTSKIQIQFQVKF